MDNISEETNSVIINKTHIEWTPEHEQILIEWGDKAMCYRWLHSKANIMYSRLNAWYTIPVIIISTLTGTANFAQERVPLEYQSFFVMIVGGFNIIAGIITTIQQFLKITQLNESHRVSSISWDKFYRNIKIEIAKHPSERIDPTQMLKISKEEFDRLIETSPNIPEKIIRQFKSEFHQEESFNKIIKPEICDTLIPTSDYRNPWYTEDNQNKVINENLKNELIKRNKVKKQNDLDRKMVSDFITLFNNLKDKMNMDTIKKIIDQNKSLSVKMASEDSVYGSAYVSNQV
jgi:hypothetical protein